MKYDPWSNVLFLVDVMQKGGALKGGLSWKICILQWIDAYSYFLYKYIILKIIINFFFKRVSV